ncbi:DUF6065 family protein [Reyranella sp. CPCC 100927]|uniref:DUF6065 family protein n=1 Tax=Reyranella sp. CPCC 100927 TaxID=2599616 RepID=UPI0011B5ABB0|nr:DUF6065 family protein [Reyranella sp. CPCC 100927]TWT05703.1 hypothetical protein FQU96_24675 [Reyranella sp. CPCC 100927]
MNPVVTFKKVVRGGLPPRRATRDAAGTLPVRAVRYCEPVSAASGFGWYVFPPIAFQIMFDGIDALWTYDGADGWFPLKVAQYPGFADEFDAAAPESAKGFSPPFLSMLDGPAILQIWTGLIVRTAPDWSLLLRAPANLPHSAGYHHFDGIIETDAWGGPLFFNVRLIQTGVPIRFDTQWPFLQVQPVHRQHYADDFLNAMQVESGLQSLSPDDWHAYDQAVVGPNKDPNRPLGKYAVAARKRRTKEGL